MIKWACGIISWCLFFLSWGNYTETQQGQAFIASMAGQAGYSKADLQALFAQVSRDENILIKIAYPAEKTKPWYEYKKMFVTPKQIEQGKDFYQAHQTVLEAAYQRFGVPPEIIVAILGIETRYGRVMGNDKVITALSTLAFDYPPRKKFFTQQLRAFLQMAKQEGFDPLVPVGSYAGAMGMAQFMPSSFLDYAIDYEGDGQRDLWHNPNDAIFSIANYLAKHGWQPEGLLVDKAIAQTAGYTGVYQHQPFITLAELKAQGLYPLTAVANEQTVVGVFQLETALGQFPWITFENFAVITRYNTSPLYAMAVIELARAIETEK